MRQLRRLLLALTQLAMLLPFVVVRGCSGTEEARFSGIGFYSQEASSIPWLLAWAALAGVLFWRPGPPGRDEPGGLAPAAEGARAIGAGLALGAAVLLPLLLQMFKNVEPLVGWVLQVTGWCCFYLMCLVGSVGGAARAGQGLGGRWWAWASVSLVGAAVHAVLQVVLQEHELGAMVPAFLVPLVVGLPLGAMVLGAGRLVAAEHPRAGAWRGAAIAATLLYLVGLGLSLT